MSQLIISSVIITVNQTILLYSYTVNTLLLCIIQLLIKQPSPKQRIDRGRKL
jgi:hypothetical protein